MPNNGKPEQSLTWTVQLGIPVPVRLARRASKTALGKYLANALGASFQAIPPEFIAQSADKVKSDLARPGTPGLVGADGRPYRV